MRFAHRMGRKWSEPLEFVGFRRNYHANFGSSSGKSGFMYSCGIGPEAGRTHPFTPPRPAWRSPFQDRPLDLGNGVGLEDAIGAEAEGSHANPMLGNTHLST